MIHTHPSLVASILRPERIMSEEDTKVKSAEGVERGTDTEEETATPRAKNIDSAETPEGSLLDVLDTVADPTRTPSTIPKFGTAKTTTATSAEDWKPVKP